MGCGCGWWGAAIWGRMLVSGPLCDGLLMPVRDLGSDWWSRWDGWAVWDHVSVGWWCTKMGGLLPWRVPWWSLVIWPGGHTKRTVTTGSSTLLLLLGAVCGDVPRLIAEVTDPAGCCCCHQGLFYLLLHDGVGGKVSSKTIQHVLQHMGLRRCGDATSC